MKILALSDEVVDFIYSPQIKDKFADVDLVLGCGDLPFYYLEFIVTMLDVPLFYVAGNHDRPTQYRSDGRVVHRAEGCEALDGVAAHVRYRADGARGRHPSSVLSRSTPSEASGRHSTLLLAGLGGCLRYNREPYHQYTQDEMAGRALRLAPALLTNRLRYGRYLDILVTHAPPRGIHDGPDLAHTGFDAFLRLMDICRPRYLLHGHAHVYRQDAVTATRYKDTEVINVYPYRLIEYQ